MAAAVTMAATLVRRRRWQRRQQRHWRRMSMGEMCWSNLRPKALRSDSGWWSSGGRWTHWWWCVVVVLVESTTIPSLLVVTIRSYNNILFVIVSHFVVRLSGTRWLVVSGTVARAAQGPWRAVAGRSAATLLVSRGSEEGTTAIPLPAPAVLRQGTCRYM